MTPVLLRVANVDDVIVPLARAARGRDAASERAAFLSLSRVPARRQRAALQEFVELAMRLTHSEASGISVLEEAADRFRWVAAAGKFAPYLNQTMPRAGSPCGTTISRGVTVAMHDPARFYGQSPEVKVGVHAMMLVPFSRSGSVIGTLWVLSSQEDKRYTVDDARIVENLLSFSAALLDTLVTREAKYGAG